MTDGAHSLTDVVAQIDDAAEHRYTSVGDVLDALGNRSFAPAILVPALLLVSPLSAVPGLPTVGAVIIVLITVQWMVRTDHLWLPDWVLRQRIRSFRLQNGLGRITRLTDWLDDHSARRLCWLATHPFRPAVKLSILVLTLPWPFFELLPMFTTLAACVVALLTFGLWARDGLYILLGYALAGATGIGLIQLASAVV